VTDQPMIEIRIRYFAMLRELLGRSEETLTIPAGTAASAIYPMVTGGQPRLAAMQRSMMLMVNEEYVRGEHSLADGDELAFIPPVSGGEQPLPKLFDITDAALDPRLVESLVAADDAGAIVTFTGTVRNHARGREVVALGYEAYAPAAEKQLGVIGVEVVERWPGMRIAIHHRTGYLTPGVASVVIACASAHRAEAFAAGEYAIDRIKEIVPIWKKEHYRDGSIWVGSEADYQAEVRAAES
jgi:molybdopterin synthase catalytic subunit